MTPSHNAAPGVVTHDGGQKPDYLCGHDSDPPPGASTPKRRSQRWKALEKSAAKKLRGRRIVREDFFESSPDVLIDDMRLVVECKSRQRHAFHSFMDQARRYCREGETPALVTKSAGERGEYITLPMDVVAAWLDEIRAARAGR